jgi:hypothetical protein
VKAAKEALGAVALQILLESRAEQCPETVPLLGIRAGAMKRDDAPGSARLDRGIAGHGNLGCLGKLREIRATVFGSRFSQDIFE